VAASGVAAFGAVVTVIPFVESWEPSERARALGAPVLLDISKLEPGQMITTVWRKQVIYVVGRAQPLVDNSQERRRSEGQRLQGLHSAGLRAKRNALAPRRCARAHRHLHASRMPAEILLRSWRSGPRRKLAGRLPLPCHGSRFDLAGRVFNGSPAPTNLSVPPYSFQDQHTLVIGLDGAPAKGAA